MARESSRTIYMDDNPQIIDLKKLRKQLPPPPVHVAPLSPPPRPIPQQVRSAPPPRPMPYKQPEAPTVPQLPPMPRPRWILRLQPYVPFEIPPGKYLIAGLIGLLFVFAIGHYIYVHVWIHSPFGQTPGKSLDTPSDNPTSDISAGGAATSTADTNMPLTQDQIIAQVGRIMLLPTDDTPSLAGVSNLDALKGQDFFRNAKVGDIVLMYAKTRRAILYDPTEDKIIEVGPITTATTTAMRQ